MSGLRLVMVNPRYWPLASEPERFWAQLAIEFQNQGARPSVLTARWAGNWPTQVTHRGFPVSRLTTAPRGGWSTYRYLREVARWLRRRAGHYDVVYVGNLRYDAYAVVGALRGWSAAVVLRPQSIGVDGDCRWQSESRIGKRIRRRCQLADAIVAPSGSALDELRTAGYARDLLAEIPLGADVPEPRTPASQFEARQALGEVNHDLAVADFAPVAVCIERLQPQRGLGELVHAWRPIARRWPSARLWIIGDGPDRQRLYERVSDLELHRQVILPGSFDEVDDVLQAADLYIAPTPMIETSTAQLAAMAAGLPVVAVASPDNRVMMESRIHGLLVPVNDRSALSQAIGELLEAPSLGAQLGEAARRRVAERYSLKHIARQHLELFSRLVGSRHRGSG